MTDSALMYFGHEAPNGMSMTAEELDILRSAFEVAFSDQTDEDMLENGYDPEVVWRVGRRVEEAFSFQATAK